MDGRAFGHVDRLHQIDLDPGCAFADHRDVFVDVLAFAAVVARHGEAEQIDPEAPQPRLVRRTNRDLLQSQNTKPPIPHITHAGLSPGNCLRGRRRRRRFPSFAYAAASTTHVAARRARVAAALVPPLVPITAAASALDPTAPVIAHLVATATRGATAVAGARGLPSRGVRFRCTWPGGMSARRRARTGPGMSAPVGGRGTGLGNERPSAGEDRTGNERPSAGEDRTWNARRSAGEARAWDARSPSASVATPRAWERRSPS